MLSRSTTADILERHGIEPAPERQGLGNRPIQPEPDYLANTGEVQCRERLGGTLNYYYRTAA